MQEHQELSALGMFATDSQTCSHLSVQACNVCGKIYQQIEQKGLDIYSFNVKISFFSLSYWHRIRPFPKHYDRTVMIIKWMGQQINQIQYSLSLCRHLS